MKNLRQIGLVHAYLDVNLDKFSNVAIGLLIRALGYKFKLLYVNDSENNSELNYFFTQFVDYKLDIIDINGINNNNKIDLDYGLIIFDNINFKKISKEKILEIIKNKKVNTEVVFVFSSKLDFNEIYDNFDLVSEYRYNSNLNNNPLGECNLNLINITGNGKGKSTYVFGQIIREIILGNNINLIYFDKGGDFYGENFFFDKLKIKFAKNAIPFQKNLNKIYGYFDYTSTGLKRFDGTKFRFENSAEDFIEAKKGIDLLKNFMNKNEIIVLEELNSTVGLKLLEEMHVRDILKLTKNKIILTGRYSPIEITKISAVIIEVVEIKHYLSAGHSVRAGIDF